MKRRLNKWEREILELRRKGEQVLERDLFNLYKDLQKHLEEVIKNTNIENLKAYQIINLNNRIAILNEINDLIKEAHESVGSEIKSYIQESYRTGNNHVKYVVEQSIQQATPLSYLDKQAIRQLLTNPIDEQLLSQNLYFNREKVAKGVQSVLLKNYADSKSYAQMANELANQTEAGFHRSMRIARTEGQRVYNAKQLDSQQEAEALGIEVKKMWTATLDGRTRGTHRSLDGQIRGINEEYVSPSGARGLAPSHMGSASEDINCRCQSLTIVEGIKPTHRRAYNEDRQGSEIIEYKTYTEWERANERINRST